MTQNSKSIDKTRLRTKLRHLSHMEAGWIDGESGQPLSPVAMSRAHSVIDTLDDLNTSGTCMHPTEAGGIFFSWPDHPDDISAEVRPDGSIYCHAVVEPGAMKEATLSASDDVFPILSEWLQCRRSIEE